MGNNHSTAHNRLSKPKTNKNSPVVPSKADSPVSVNSRYPELSVEARQQIKDALLSPVDPESVPSAPTPAKEEVTPEPVVQTRGRALSIISRSNSRTNSRTNSRSNSLSFFGSKHGSASKLGGGDSKVSLGSAGQLDVEAAIKLLQEVKKNASPEELAALHEALEPVEEDVAQTNEHDLNYNDPLINRSSSSLTRRRSVIQTPGVATRNSPIEGRRRTWNSWKAPQLNAEQEEKWRGASNRTPLSNRLAVSGPTAEDCHDSIPRARTPSELDYSHLGSLKLGTLKVINGAPSPAPSAKLTKQQPSTATDEDYFSATEVGGSPLMMKQAKRRGHIRSKSAVSPSTIPLYEHDIPVPTLKPRNLHVQTNIAPQSRDTQGTCGVHSTSERAWAYETRQTHNAHDFAQSYQSEIPMSPFSNMAMYSQVDSDREVIPVNIAENQRETIEDGQSMRYELDASAESTASALSSAIPCENPVRQKPKGQRPLPQSADSGYSSGGSFRTRNSRQHHSDPFTISDGSRNSPEAEVVAHTPEPVELHAESIGYEQTLFPAAQLPPAQRRPRNLKIPEQTSRSPTKSSASEATLSPRTPSSIGSKDSIDNARLSSKHAKKRRPSQPPAPVVQSCQSIPEGTIPNIPDNVRIKFTRRISSTPGMDCLTNTYPTKEHILAAEYAGDDASVSIAAFPQFTELEPERQPTPQANGRRRSLSLFRRKSYGESVSREKVAAVQSLGVVDLGTIATSLGTSPYDAAMSGPTGRTVTSPTHPHQLGHTTPRAKSMVNMDARVAAEFARTRSKDLAVMPPQLIEQRRKSDHNLKREVGEAKAARRRPQTSEQDIPPVPLIDGSKHKGSQIAAVRSHDESRTRPEPGTGASARSRSQRQAISTSTVQHEKNGHALSQGSSQHGVDWEVHSLAWSRRRKSIGEGLRNKTGTMEASASSINSRAAAQAPQEMGSWGRFSGGLGYNYQGGGIIAGSAGTQSAVHKLATSKSMQWKMQHGVDLSDVPIMVQRA